METRAKAIQPEETTSAAKSSQKGKRTKVRPIGYTVIAL